MVVNNAGTFHVDKFLDLSFDTWRRVMAVNADGPFLVGQAAARRMVQQPMNETLGRRGMIINVGSSAGDVGRPPRAAYGASKAVVKHLTMTQSKGLREHAIAAALIIPGEVRDGMLAGIYRDTAVAEGRTADAVAEERVAHLPRRVFQTPEEVADRMVFLASTPGMDAQGTCCGAIPGSNPCKP